MAAGAGDHLMLSRLGLGNGVCTDEENAGTSTTLLHEGVVNTVTFVSGSTVLATGSGKVVALWDINLQTMTETLLHEATVAASALSPDGYLLATVGNDRKCSLWAMPNGKLLQEIDLDGWVKCVAFSRDGKMLAAAGATAAITVWSVTSAAAAGGGPIATPRHVLNHDGTVNALAFSSDSLILASGGMDKRVRVWDTSSGQMKHELAHEDYVLALAFAPALRSHDHSGVINPPVLAAGGGDKRVTIWDAVQGDMKATLLRDATVYCIEFSPSGDLLATGGADKKASLWSRSGRLLHEVEQDSSVKSLSFSKSGNELAISCGKEVRVSTVVCDRTDNSGANTYRPNQIRLRPHMNEEVARSVNLPLLRATKDGDLQAVDRLLSMGLVDINFANQHGDTPLILACWYSHKFITARLLDHGADVDITNCDGNCALNVAAYRGNVDALEMLLRHRCKVDVPDHMTGKTALIKAAYVGHTQTAIALLDAKADVNHADTQGYTALAFATSFNHEYMIQVLLHSDADPNVQDVFGITPLIHAAARGRFDAVQMLLQAGARPLLVDSEGKTAIDYAESAQFPDVVAELREAAQLEPVMPSSPSSPMPPSPFGQPYESGPMTPRVPNQIEVKMTPRVPGSGGLTPRSGSPSKLPLSPSITRTQLSPLPKETMSGLAKKLVHLSVMLEQDTVADDTRYPTFQMR